MIEFIPKDIVIGTKKSIYVIVFLCFCIFSCSVFLITKYHENIDDVIVGSFNCALPLLALSLCYIIWDNHEYYTSTRSSKELKDLSHKYHDLTKSNKDIHSEIIEKLNTLDGKKNIDSIKDIKDIKNITSKLKR